MDIDSFIVTGIANGQRYAGVFAAADHEDAERSARSVMGAGLMISATIGPGQEIHTASYPPEMGPGTPEWSVARGQVNTDPDRAPSIGDVIYVGPHDDATGGLATVTKVVTTGRDPMVTVDEQEGWSMNWRSLAAMQERLRESYGFERARMDERYY